MNSLLLPIVIPGAAGLLVLALPRRLSPLRTVAGVLGALATLLAAAWLIDTRADLSLPWMSLGGLDLDFALRLDAFSSWTTVLVGP